MVRGLIFDIQRFCTHDGPGIRTTVFLKGCSLRCYWCHNPESISFSPELMLHKERCIGCGNCLKACCQKAIAFSKEGISVSKDKCLGCGSCASICASKTLVLKGNQMSVETVMDVIRKDIPYYKKSGGGVTFSGGEALLQLPFLMQILKQCQEENIHTALDTAGNVDFENFEAVLPYTNLFLYDVKACDMGLHQAGTGNNNQRILDNLKRLAGLDAPMEIRIPVIPGFNDTPNEIKGIADIVKGLGPVQCVKLLKFHRLGSAKYESLGMDYKGRDLMPPNDENMNSFAEIFSQIGLLAEIE